MTQITDRAAALYDGGWRSTDKTDLMTFYDLSDSEAQDICSELEEIERSIAAKEVEA